MTFDSNLAYNRIEAIMEEIIETQVPSTVVWQAWERFQAGQKGRSGAFKYKVLSVDPGKSFSILWKTLFVRLVFVHSVEPLPRGSLIRYQIQIRGIFSLPLKWLIGNKIRKNVSAMLRSFVRQLEESQRAPS